jgi:hypothetical protein
LISGSPFEWFLLVTRLREVLAVCSEEAKSGHDEIRGREKKEDGKEERNGK